MASGARRWRARARVGWLAACTVTMSARLRAIIVSLYVCSTESFLSKPNRTDDRSTGGAAVLPIAACNPESRHHFFLLPSNPCTSLDNHC